MMKKSLAIAAMVPLLWACESTTPGAPGQVAVRFGAVSPSASAWRASTSEAPGGASYSHAASPNAITLTGTNGTLVIQDIRLILAEIELERAGGECIVEDSDDCEEFEGGPFLVNLLSGTASEIVSALVPAGLYEEFEFEVENLDLDGDDDDGEQQAKEEILATLRQDYPAFPSNGSMVVHGTFNDQLFTVYFDAEIEVEREFATPFRVPEDEAVAVYLDPALWFMSGSQVMDLSALDGQTISFEAEFENGVTEIRSEDD